MVAWGQTLSEKEIRSFVIYNRERRAMYERGQLEIARPVESMTAHSQHHDFQLNTVSGPGITGHERAILL